MIQKILQAYDLNPEQYQFTELSLGLINKTWKVEDDGSAFILQRVNTNVFTAPYHIADNLRLIAVYLADKAPGYTFAAPLPTSAGAYLLKSDDSYFRLLPFIPESNTVNSLNNIEQAFEAAQQFAKFTALLDDFDTTKLKDTIPDFHNLSFRVKQFREALITARAERLAQAKQEIRQVEDHLSIAELYDALIKDHDVPRRVIHHDAKINNVLFDRNSKGLAIVDLDTVMAGYYISDVGDMMRTYLASASEEERDLGKINIRTDYFAPIYTGYMSYMGDKLTRREKDLFIYAGEFMIYMQAVRFLTDFLNGDTYYRISYANHNLVRTKNQLKLLELYELAKPEFSRLIKLADTKSVPPH